MISLEADVLIVGGGMAGTCAAIAAARSGSQTILVERNGFLGGAATAAAVGQFVGWETEAGRRVIAGLAEEVVARLIENDGAHGHSRFVMSTGHAMDRVQYNPEILKCVLDSLAAEAGVDLLFHAWQAGADKNGARIDGARFLTKSGEISIRARQFVDATGDLDLLQAVGAPMLRADRDRLQPGTLMFAIGPIDFDRFDAIELEEKGALARRGFEEGALARPALHCSRVPGSDHGWFNVTRVTVDGSDARSLSQAEIEGRRQALAAARYIIDKVPGCENARLSAFAPQLGIRETRRALADHTITVEDLASARRFDDTIACGAYPIDLHKANSGALTIEGFGADHAYCVPLRALIVRDFDNLQVAGRGISATQEAHGALRVMPLAMAMGQAVGTAAAMAAGAGNDPAVRDIDISALRDRLSRAGAIIDPDA